MTHGNVIFSQLRLRRWRQFGEVDIEFHPTLTVLTGANGSGKSTVLGVLSQHFGWARPLLSTPASTGAGGYSYLTDVLRWLDVADDPAVSSMAAPAAPSGGLVEIGSLAYSDGRSALLRVPEQGAAEYQVQIAGQAAMSGVQVGSHRQISRYQRVDHIPAQPMLPTLAYQQWWQEVMTYYGGGYSGATPTLRMKEALIAMAVFGEGNRHSDGNPVVLKAFRGFVDVLRQLLPPTLGFEDLLIRSPEIVLRTRTGEWPLDAASGGVMTLIDLAWQIFMYAHDKDNFVVTLDEPENHLHPSMQRTLMSSLLAAFPRVQFIVATHSPFIVSSVRDSHVYVLRYVLTPAGQAVASPLGGRDHWVESVRLAGFNKAGTAGDILRDVLGVPATMPEWVERDLDDVVARYKERPITTETLGALREELSERGLGELYPDALAGMTRGR